MQKAAGFDEIWLSKFESVCKVCNYLSLLALNIIIHFLASHDPNSYLSAKTKD